MSARLDVTGTQEMLRKMKQLRDPRLLSRIERSALQKAGTVVRNAMKQWAPIDDGVLVNAITKKSKTYRGVPHIYVGPIWIRAPHQHLVEYGTKTIRYPKTAKVLVEKLGTARNVLGRWARPMPARPFARPAFDAVKERLSRKMAQDIMESIDKELAKR